MIFLMMRTLLLRELNLYKQAGGASVVDLTNIGLGRNPLALKRISEATGVHIIMGSGWYRDPFYPEEIQHRPTNDLAREIENDLTRGVANTDVRAGVIGEIGVNLDYVTPAEERVLRAAARAHKHTGAPISLHGEYFPIGLKQLDILEEEGVDLRHVIVGHADSYLNLNYHEEIARRGAYIEFDGIGRPHIYPDQLRIQAMSELIKRGHTSRLLVATDRCRRSDLHLYGGEGYDHILLSFIPSLKEVGVDDEIIYTITVENPKKILAFLSI